MNRPPDKFNVAHLSGRSLWSANLSTVDWREIENFTIVMAKIDLDHSFCLFGFPKVEGIGGRTIYQWDRARLLTWILPPVRAEEIFKEWDTDPIHYREYSVSEAEWYEQTA